MKFGISLPIFIDTTVDENLEIATLAEKLGFDYVCASDHVIVPNSLRGRFAETFCDPFVILAAIAAKTDKINIATSVSILPYRNPLIVAKMACTLDHLSGGRFILGVGPGWLAEEFDSLGLKFSERGRRTDEYIAVIRELCEQDNPSFSGEFFDFKDIVFAPKPLHDSQIPIWIGGNSSRAIKRAAGLGDGWQPIWIKPENLKPEIEKLGVLLQEKGRDPIRFPVSVRNRCFMPISPSDEKRTHVPPGPPADFMFSGPGEKILERVIEYQEVGVEHLVFDFMAKSAGEIIDTIHKFSEEVIAKFKQG